MDQLQQSLFTKQDLIEALTEEKESFRLHQVQPLTQEIESLTLRLQVSKHSRPVPKIFVVVFREHFLEK